MSDSNKDNAKGFFQSSSFRVVAVLAAFALGCILVVLATVLVIGLDLTPLWIIPPALISSLLILGGALGIAGWAFALPVQELDDALAPLGLAGKPYQLGARQYHGIIGERRVDVYLSHGPYLEVCLSTSLKTRLYVAAKVWGMGLILRQSKLSFEDPRLNDMIIRVWDEPWARTALARSGAVDPLCRLICMENARLYRTVSLHSGELRFALSTNRSASFGWITPDMVRQRLEDMLALVEALEEAPAPEGIIEETQWEKLYRSMGSPNPRILAAIISLVTLFLCCIGALVGAMLFSLLTL